jgi:periplasmic protein TonB
MQMATCDHPSDLAQRIPYPSLHRPGLRIDFRVAALPEEEEKQLPVPSSQLGIEECSLFREIEPGAKLKRNPLAGAGALVLQCLFVLAVVVIPLLHTVPLRKRETVTMLYLQPPPAAAGHATKFRAPTTPRPSIATATSTGTLAPVHKTQEAPPPPVGTTSVVGGGVPGGVVGGVSGGVLNEMLNSAPSVPVLAKSPVPAPVKRIRVAARVAEANLIRDVTPQYPTEAGRARLEGTVVLMAVIDKDGSVKDVRVESGLPILAQAAIDAVKQWRYKPYLVDGEPVEVDSRITINFTLSKA